MKMTCPVCGVGTAKKVKRSHQTKYNGQMVDVPSVEMFHCTDCGEDFFTPDQSRVVSIEVKNTVRKVMGLLPPDKIRAVREKANLTQGELEFLLDQGPKVVTRWESGRVIQNQNADTILRMLDRDAKTLEILKTIAKERQKAQAKHGHERELVAAR